MRILVVLVASSIAHATPPMNPPITTLVGQLTLQHTRKCEKGVEEWVDPHYEIGFVRVVGENLAPLEGKLVVAEGEVTEIPVPPVVRDGSCPVPQMREDMVESKGGMRRRRGRNPMNGFRISKIRPFGGLSARRDGDEVEVRFTNELGRSLPIQITLHYEGCYGKPNTAQRVDNLTVEAGKSATVRFPVRVEQQGATPDRAIHAASTVQVSTPAAGIALVIDQRIDGPSACPKR